MLIRKLTASVLIGISLVWLLSAPGLGSALAILVAVLSAAVLAGLRAPPLLRCGHCVMSYHILSTETGDTRVVEEFRDVRAHGWPAVSKFRTFIESTSGYFQEPSHRDISPQPQNITWEWLDKSGTKRSAFTHFDPPVGKSPISYVREGITFNMIAFSRRDRLDTGVSPEAAKTERIWRYITHRYESLTIRIVFPGSVPLNNWHEVRQGPTAKGALQKAEVERLRSALSTPAAHTLQLFVEAPQRAFSYHIAWELPADDLDPLALTAADSGLASELQEKLWNLASAGAEVQAEVRQALSWLQQKIEAEHHSGDLNLALYAYGRMNETGALACVADLRASVPNRTTIKVGRTPVGRCFRRKQPLQVNTLNGLAIDNDSYEAVPGEERLPAPKFGLAIPLFCPEPRGRRIGVLYLTTRENLTKLSGLIGEEQPYSDFLKMITVWYASRLTAALGFDRSILKQS
jgi:hypothetical protein